MNFLITYRLASPVTPAPRPDLTSSLHASLAARPSHRPSSSPAHPAGHSASQPASQPAIHPAQLLAWIQTRCYLCKQVCDLAGQLASQPASQPAIMQTTLSVCLVLPLSSSLAHANSAYSRYFLLASSQTKSPSFPPSRTVQD